MNEFKRNYSFIAIGKTQESTEATEGFKRYIGLANSQVIAVNPTKAELEKIYGREISEEPKYTIEDEDRGTGTVVDILVKTDPATNNDIDIIAHVRFNLFPTPCYNKDKTSVRIIDNYGNSVWMPEADAKAGKKPLTKNGDPAAIDTKYRIAFVGEADIIDFLRKFVFRKGAFNMVDGTWVKREDAEDVHIYFTNPKKLLSGDVTEIKEAIAYQPHNKIKLLYGVRTNNEGKQYQQVLAAYDMMLRNNANATAIASLEKRLIAAKNSGMYASVEYKVQELQEYTVEPTNLSNTPATDAASTDDFWGNTAASSSELPWES